MNLSLRDLRYLRTELLFRKHKMALGTIMPKKFYANEIKQIKGILTAIDSEIKYREDNAPYEKVVNGKLWLFFRTNDGWVSFPKRSE